MEAVPHNPTAWQPTTAGVHGMGDPGPIRQLTAIHPEYPERLRELPDAPPELWVLGRTPAAGERGIAIVGSRAATRKGCELAQIVARDLAAQGLFIVSGAALGIDGAAHRGALDAPAGVTFAVLGTGVDVPYPDRHAGLLRQIAMAGGVLSQYAPGTAPRPGQFPARNRLVAALAEAVLVVEARARSGALITAALARKLGRRLLAVPGSSGTDRLLASGVAQPVDGTAAVLAALAGGGPEKLAIPAGLQGLVRALGDGPAGPGSIARTLGLALPTALSIITEAEMSGWIRRMPGGMYEVTRGN